MCTSRKWHWIWYTTARQFYTLKGYIWNIRASFLQIQSLFSGNRKLNFVNAASVLKQQRQRFCMFEGNPLLRGFTERHKHSLYQMLLCPTQLMCYERPQEKTMHWARGGKGLANGSDWRPCHDLKQSLDPFRLTASYAAQTASSGRITAASGRLRQSPTPTVCGDTMKLLCTEEQL